MTVTGQVPDAIAPVLRTVERLGVEHTLPGDADYESERLLYNRMHDRRPAALVRPVDAVQTAAVLRTAIDHEVPVAVRGGGHHIAGFASLDGGVVIDQSRRRAVRLDPATQVAHVEPGARLGDVDRALLAAGRVVPTGTVSDTGITGLTLGGGIGWLVGSLGLTCDHLVGADVVLPSGAIVRAEDPRHEDLLWALRGGGTGLGVITELRLRTHELPTFTIATCQFHPGRSRQAARALIELLRTPIARELTVAATIAPGPNGPALGVDACLVHGPPSRRSLDELRRTLGPADWSVDVGADLLRWQQAFDQEFLPPRRGRWRSRYSTDITEADLHAVFDGIASTPAGVRGTALLEHLHGAVTDVDASTSAFPLRWARFGVLVAARWDDPIQDDRAERWVRSLGAALDPDSTAPGYANYAQDEDPGIGTGRGRIHRSRLQRTKDRYDPSDALNRNHGLRASDGATPTTSGTYPGTAGCGSVRIDTDLARLLQDAPGEQAPGLLIWQRALDDEVAEAISSPQWPCALLQGLPPADGWRWAARRSADGVPADNDAAPVDATRVHEVVSDACAGRGNACLTLQVRDYRERDTDDGGRDWWSRRCDHVSSDAHVARQVVAAIQVLLARAAGAGLELFVEEVVAVIAKDPAAGLATPTPTLHSDEHYGWRETAIASVAAPGWSSGTGTLFLPDLSMDDVWDRRPIDLDAVGQRLSRQTSIRLRSGDLAIYGGMVGPDGSVDRGRGVPHLSPDVAGSSCRLLLLMHARPSGKPS